MIDFFGSSYAFLLFFQTLASAAFCWFVLRTMTDLRARVPNAVSTENNINQSTNMNNNIPLPANLNNSTTTENRQQSNLASQSSENVPRENTLPDRNISLTTTGNNTLTTTGTPVRGPLLMENSFSELARTSTQAQQNRIRFVDNLQQVNSSDELQEVRDSPERLNRTMYQSQTSMLGGSGLKMSARKPEVFDGKENIEEWLDGLKAYFACVNHGFSTEGVLVSQVKSFMGPNALKALRHILRGETCEWAELKQWMEVAFSRRSLEYQELNSFFFARKQLADESFPYRALANL